MIFAGLRRAGVLGINRRNACYTLRWNPRRFYPLVDDKLATKRLCQQAGIPVPALLAVARHHFQIRNLLPALADRASFVLKPVHGAMGNGIIVIAGRERDRLVRVGGRTLRPEAFNYHAAGIISGLYSLGGQPDIAMVEERLETHPLFAELATQGVPDVRVIVYRGVPVMAMMRLPTKASDGRANLHQGALGVGVDLLTGRTRAAIWRGRPATRNPDSGRLVLDVAVPTFERILEIAVRAADRTHLGYVGADVVIDATRGPVILELNARPGLAIQLANRAGLRPRLDTVDATWQPDRPLEERVALGRDLARRHPPRAA
ncbi:MAG TPA: alpha-L-glutamate ligase-like protein [Candidatus Limnocylindria bacterium]|nr:alpha-L-glutamate ligase-like protein [Candidatus Limnocylindria bacterium]